MEKWKDIDGYKGYRISNKGNVRNPRGRLLKHVGFPGRVFLREADGTNRSVAVKRLVAEAFVFNPDPKNLRFVEYINGDASNNNAENLGWQTNPQSKAVICVETGEVYNSIKEAAEAKYVQESAISNVCRKTTGFKTAGGYHWKYLR